ncbi:MAG TPA: hypothetical protein VLL08_32890 [Kineosporiaceae bacterium]|nr:hypothetical protein [Kineosporiaceae bacterium]
MTDPVADAAAQDRAFVKMVALYDPRSLVRTAAWNALLSTRETAVADFLASGYASAVKRANATKARNLDFAKRVLATHTVDYAPQVHAAAKQAVNGTDADRERFVKTEYAAAMERDRLARLSEGQQAAAIVQADRDFVLATSTTDPGTQVRAAALYALRTGAGDAGLVEFFTYDWVQASVVDLDMYRTTRADQEILWRSVNRRLLLDAQTADQAARSASATEAAQARAVAARAWKAVGDQTGPARTAWGQAQELAQAQALNWQQVALAAAAAGGQNWSAIGTAADAVQTDWALEKQQATDQAAYWAALLAQAVAGERGMQPLG